MLNYICFDRKNITGKRKGNPVVIEKVAIVMTSQHISAQKLMTTNTHTDEGNKTSTKGNVATLAQAQTDFNLSFVLHLSISYT